MDFDYLFSVLGFLLVLEGLPYFAFPELFKRLMAQLPSVPDRYPRTVPAPRRAGFKLLEPF